MWYSLFFDFVLCVGLLPHRCGLLGGAGCVLGCVFDLCLYCWFVDAALVLWLIVLVTFTSLYCIVHCMLV